MLTIAKASAGAGKTFLLAKTYIDMLFRMQGHNRHRHILAVTFTKKATAEMKGRIIAELAKLATGAPSDYHAFLTQKYNLTDDTLRDKAESILYELLQDYSAFMVTTIDSFFQQIIRSFARELNLSGSYNLELDSAHILQTAVDDFFFNLSDDTADPSVKLLIQIVEKKLADNKSWNPTDTILSLSNELLKEVFQNNSQALSRFCADATQLDNYTETLHTISGRYKKEYENLKLRLQKLLADNGLQEQDFSYGKLVFAPFSWDMAKIRKDYAKLPVRFSTLCENSQAILKKNATPAMQSVAQAAQSLALELRNMLQGEPMRQLLSAEAIAEYLPYLTLLLHISDCITQANRRLNRLPIAETNALLEKVIGENNDTPFVYEKIGTRIAHYLIDEFQDTSTAQWRNFRPLVGEALAGNNANLVVGDVKQSIYRWRNSDYSLLQTGLINDFGYSSPYLLNMGDNWRSDRVVVETNNRLFQQLAEAEDAEFNNLIGDNCSSLKGKIHDVYEGLAQCPKKNKEDGYVHMEFIAAKTDNERRECVLQRLPALLEDIRSRNIPLGRVAVLVRRNSEAVPVASALIHAGYNVLSAEGLLLMSAPQVRFVIAVLRWLLTPDDRIIRLQVLHEYALLGGKDTSQALSEALKGSLSAENEPLWEVLNTLSGLPLYDTLQQLVFKFGLDKTNNAKPYVQGLLDTVYNYIRRYQADLFSFLEWWDEHAGRLAVAMQADNDAIQILSVHKSKGLEYDVVIIPFCDWPKSVADKGNRLDILWAKPKEEPFAKGGDVPLVPLRFSAKLADTVFAEDYWQEVQNRYLDNLNLTYVAFTRAKRELYVFAPSSQVENAKGELKEDTSTIGALLHSLLLPQLQKEDIWEQGTPVCDAPCVTASALQSSEQEQSQSVPLADRLKIKHAAYKAFITDNADNYANRLNLGLVMHDLLCQVLRKGDEIDVMEAMLRQGRITETEYGWLVAECERFWNLVGQYDWFSADWQVLNEQDILLPNGTTKRPDRVMLNADKAVVVDYKFGLQQPEKYNRQVRAYMHLLSDMGYQVQGYLCYVSLESIVEVSA